MIARLALSLIAVVFSLYIAPSVIPGSTAQPRLALATIVFQTDMYGWEQVPPIQTQAWGFFRFFFSDDKSVADVTVDVKGLSNSLVAAADIHRGVPGVNGPVVKHLSDGNFIVTSARVRFTTADLDEMAAGDWYISLKSKQFPNGELRGQIVLPEGFWTAPAPAPIDPVYIDPVYEVLPAYEETPPDESTPFLAPIIPIIPVLPVYVPIIIPFVPLRPPALLPPVPPAPPPFQFNYFTSPVDPQQLVPAAEGGDPR